ncbi:MAG: SPASM domain-containing protein [Anaerolineae bacterium]|nr:SPASM domain-containing protein [Anaerolineae bacterium]
MPLLVIDFWNDAPLAGGCIAGGREYFHINNKGDVEPCIFTHFATDNAKTKSLRACLQSDFFRAIRARQPFNENLLMPCMLIDNPWVFREIHAQCNPYPTHAGAESLVGALAPGLDAYAGHLAEMMAPAWQEDWIAQGRVWPFTPEPDAADAAGGAARPRAAERASDPLQRSAGRSR